MENLNQEQKKEIVEFCKKHEDVSYLVIAREFTNRFGVQLTHQDIYSLNLNQLMGQPL